MVHAKCLLTFGAQADEDEDEDEDCTRITITTKANQRSANEAMRALNRKREGRKAFSFGCSCTLQAIRLGDCRRYARLGQTVVIESERRASNIHTTCALPPLMLPLDRAFSHHSRI